MTGFRHRVLAGLLLGQVPIMKRGSLHGMPGDLCDYRFNGSMTQLFRGRVYIPSICIVIATNTTEAQICFPDQAWLCVAGEPLLMSDMAV